LSKRGDGDMNTPNGGKLSSDQLDKQDIGNGSTVFDDVKLVRYAIERAVPP
jgi:hypothetical protein